MNKVEGKNIQRINETSSQHFEKINTIDKPLTKLIKRKLLFKLIKQELKKGDFCKDTQKLSVLVGALIVLGAQ